MPRLGTLVGMDLTSILFLENRKKDGRFGAGRPDGNSGRDGPDKCFVWKIKQRMVGLGQGAQIGNFGRDGPAKYFPLANQKENGRLGAGHPDWELR